MSTLDRLHLAFGALERDASDTDALQDAMAIIESVERSGVFRLTARALWAELARILRQ